MRNIRNYLAHIDRYLKWINYLFINGLTVAPPYN